MASLTLIRHAETIWNRERRMQGQTDTPLSDVGRMQAAALGERLAEVGRAGGFAEARGEGLDVVGQGHVAGGGEPLAHEARAEPRAVAVGVMALENLAAGRSDPNDRRPGGHQ